MVMENRTRVCRHATSGLEKACQDAEEARHHLCMKEFVIGGYMGLTKCGELKRDVAR